MMINTKHIILIVLMSFVPDFKGQWAGNSFKEISSLINTYPENDERAMVYVQIYVQKAKKAGDVKKLIEGYEDAIYYTDSANRKLLYADSAISAAEKLNDPAQISRAYLGKGIIYYYNTRNHKKALEEYLRAFTHSKNIQDDYLKNKIVYHLGMVKCYLGSYAEASKHFTETAAYFEEARKKRNIHRNLKLNYESGYFNSIYRLSECYRNLHEFVKEDSLVDLGLKNMKAMGDHSAEYGYFQLARGIRLMRQKSYSEVLNHFKVAESILKYEEDFAGLTTVSFYLGKYYREVGERNLSISYLKKIDSVFNKLHYITPEIRFSYEYLIDDAKQNKNKDSTLYYTTQLLKADSIIIADQPNLSSKISYEYDTEMLTSEKDTLLKDKHISYQLLLIFFFVSISTVGIIIDIYHRKKERLTLRYQQLIKDIEEREMSQSPPYVINLQELDKNYISVAEPAPEMVHSNFDNRDLQNIDLINEILQRLRVFEEKKGFLKENMKLTNLALLLKTNRTTLSYIFNECLHTPYPDYIKKLRINYITSLMMEDRKYLLLNVEILAQMCGMSSRQVFRLHFKDINGMSPIEFMKRRLDELDKNQPNQN